MFLKIITQAVKSIWGNRHTLTKALAIPFFLLLVFSLVIGEIDTDSLIYFLVDIPNLAVYSLFAITTHRVILLGPEAVPKWGIHQWSKRETSFFLYLLGLTVTTWFFIYIEEFPIPDFAVIWVILVGFILFTTLWVRWSLVFPAIALGHKSSFKISWELTKNNIGIMFKVICLFPILLYLPWAVIILGYEILGEENQNNIFLQFIYSALATFVTVFEVAALSVAYKSITDENAKEQIEASEPGTTG